jgi:MarR family transcriptional regulator for hemolysin
VTPPKTPDPLRNLGFLLKDVARLYTRNFERHASGLGLTLDQCKVLCHLQRNEGISQVRLAEYTDTDPMTLGRLLDRMETDGLVERRPDPADRRARSLHLEAAAQPALEQIWDASDRARAQSLSGLNAADRAQLMKLLQRLHANLEALLPEVAGNAALKSARSPARATSTP